ncbi:methylated-DNA--[protein]-cysteine S-methyltransferase [Schlesneria paludicola]|uniref:methylated-DNA--[protein]-cysteine S-methyltransferase n=1 Tax=Schlesneria paludicola TaxID=360056 RepID=UPI00029AEB24|nr:methylated-DNA--[protein]-cysteine S-methyltransferase [Schlesneria paludicola]
MPYAAKRARPTSAQKPRPAAAAAPDFEPRQMAIATFQTELGWFGLLGIDEQLTSVFIGHPNEKSVVQRATQMASSIEQIDWAPKLRGQLEAYCDGEIIDFSHVALQLPATTKFRQQIVAATRRLRYGEVASYGELAKRIGHPGAARAVGTVMSTNQFPIVIPCHRVIAAGGKLGGFSSPSGTNLKERMLDLEARALGISRTHLLDQGRH